MQSLVCNESYDLVLLSHFWFPAWSDDSDNTHIDDYHLLDGGIELGGRQDINFDTSVVWRNGSTTSFFFTRPITPSQSVPIQLGYSLYQGVIYCVIVFDSTTLMILLLIKMLESKLCCVPDSLRPWPNARVSRPPTIIPQPFFNKWCGLFNWQY